MVSNKNVHAQTKGSKMWAFACVLNQNACNFCIPRNCNQRTPFNCELLLDAQHSSRTALRASIVHCVCACSIVFHAVTYRRCLLIKHIYIGECLFFVRSFVLSVPYIFHNKSTVCKTHVFQFWLAMRTCECVCFLHAVSKRCVMHFYCLQNVPSDLFVYIIFVVSRFKTKALFRIFMFVCVCASVCVLK